MIDGISISILRWHVFSANSSAKNSGVEANDTDAKDAPGVSIFGSLLEEFNTATSCWNKESAMSIVPNPGCLFDIGDCTTQLL